MVLCRCFCHSGDLIAAKEGLTNMLMCGAPDLIQKFLLKVICSNTNLEQVEATEPEYDSTVIKHNGTLHNTDCPWIASR